MKIILTVVAVFVLVVVAGVVFSLVSYEPQTVTATTLRVALSDFGAQTLDPSMDSQEGLKYHGHLYDHMVGVSADGKLDTQLGILKGWGTLSDASAYILTLEEGTLWHDGREITSSDIASSFQHYFREGASCGGCGALKQSVQNIEVVDRYNARVTLNQPDVVFMGRIGPIEGDMPLLPSHVITGGDLDAQPIGSGPWRLLDRAEGESISFEANKDYWNSERMPEFQRMRILQVPEEQTRIAMLQSGTIDITPISIPNLPEIKREGFSIEGPQYILSTTLRFFMGYDSDFLTSSLEFRKALALGTDLDSILDEMYPPEAASLPTGSALFSPITEGYDLALPPYAYEPDMARQLLQESGYAGEPVSLLSLTAYGETAMPFVTQAIAEQWREIGVNAQVVATDFPAVQASYLARPQDFDAYAPAPIFHGASPARPGGILTDISRYLKNGDAGFLSYHDLTEGDRIYQQVSSTVDSQAREQILRELNRKMYDEYWAIPVVWRHETYALRDGLTGWQPTNGTPNNLHFETIRRMP